MSTLQSFVVAFISHEAILVLIDGPPRNQVLIGYHEIEHGEAVNIPDFEICAPRQSASVLDAMRERSKLAKIA